VSNRTWVWLVLVCTLLALLVTLAIINTWMTG
jgi:hypothetical protein